jgi:hypothetical protein
MCEEIWGTRLSAKSSRRTGRRPLDAPRPGLAELAAAGCVENDYKRECGKGMHKRIMSLHDDQGITKVQNLHMIDIWDDAVAQPDKDWEGTPILTCKAKAAFTIGGDREIVYGVVEKRGTYWVYMREADRLTPSK